MEGYRRKPSRDYVRGEVWGYETEVKQWIERGERLALRNKLGEEEHLKVYGGLREIYRNCLLYTSPSPRD